MKSGQRKSDRLPIQEFCQILVTRDVTFLSLNFDGKKKSEDSSQASFTAKSSQDAAVGVLVHMLRTAPPLSSNSSCYIGQSSKPEVVREIGVASEFFKPRNTTDALEELKAYKEMKDLILSNGEARISVKEKD
ncbi:unnamed protein product [Fraxinus pennsylvanica]|uniref:Uncharacterized protein n=1 Tax=Fraxinus pennsylvanica TaxID=56036 RepID=A0AAD1YTM0_9LAMI|nr:unnamed protein product [Fraxinus pennsylvanica]